MCIYTIEMKKIKILKGMRNSTERLKIGSFNAACRITQKLSKIEACHIAYS